MPDLFVPTTTDPITSVPPKPAPSVTVPGVSHFVMPFSTFSENPTNVTFSTQDSDENILLFMRAHFITNIGWIITTLVLFLIPLILIALLNLAGNLFPFDLSSIPTPFLLIFLVFYYLIVFTYMFASFLTWFYNIGIVTQKRVVDIDYRDLIFHDVAMTKLDLVEDVNYTQGGFAASFFNYGNVYVQTAGKTKNFDFLSVPRPTQATSIIEELIGGPRHV